MTLSSSLCLDLAESPGATLTDCFELTRADRSVRMALFHHMVWAIENGQLWMFHLRMEDVGSVDRAELWLRYVAHRRNPSLSAPKYPWPLHVNAKTMRIVQATLPATVSTDEKKMAALQAALAVVLRYVRHGLPRETRAALARYRHTDGSLAHWLTAGHPERAAYRIQALHQHPVLLPLALKATLQWPMPEIPAEAVEAMREPRQRGQHLAQAIDRGAPWANLLPDILNVGCDQNWIFHSGSWLQREGKPASRLDDAQVRWLGGRPRGEALGPWRCDTWERLHLIETAFHLSAGRRPKSRAAWKQLMTFELNFPGGAHSRFQSGTRAPLGDAFFKGLPEDLAHPDYKAMFRRLPMVMDMFRWMHDPDNVEHNIGQSLSRLSWLQWNQYTDRAHDWDETMAPKVPRVSEHQQLRWRPLCEAGPWCAPNLGIALVELTCEWDLIDEGEAMRHCVADYAVDCAMGRSRVFSVRDATGQRLSTLEVIWDDDPTDPRKVTVAQHFSRRNKTVIPEATLAVTTFLNDLESFRPGPWRATVAGQKRQRMARVADDVSHRPALRERLWGELDRRYPVRVKAPMNQKRSLDPRNPVMQANRDARSMESRIV